MYLYRWLHYIGRNNSDNTSARRISCIAPALYFLSSPLWQFVVFFWPDDVADLLVVMVIAREVFSPLVFWATGVGRPSDAREGTQRHVLPKRPGGTPLNPKKAPIALVS